MSEKLSPQQTRFVLEYVKDPAHNGKQAAIRAGYSEATAKEQASRLLTNVNVQSEIKKQIAKQEEQLGFDGLKVLKELGAIAFADIEPPSKDPDTGLTEWPAIRASDKTKALELLGKHFKLFTDKVEHSGNLTLAQLLEAVEEEPED